MKYFKYVRVFIILYLISANSFATKDPESKLTFSGKLAGEKALLLREGVTSGYYEVSVLERRRASGEIQRVVILGEEHIKNKHASELGKKIAEKFQTIGVEGHFIKDPSFIEKIGHRYRSTAYSIYGAVKFRTDIQDSSITDVIRKYDNEFMERPKFEQSIIIALAAYETNNLLFRDLPRVNVANLEEASREFYRDSLGLSEDFEITCESYVSEIVPKLRKKLFYENNKTDVIRLEWFDAPPKELRNYFKILGSSGLLMACGAITWLAGSIVPDSLMQCIYTSSVLAAGASLTIFGSMLLPKQCEADLGHLWPAMNARNKIMVDRTVKALNLRPEIEEILVIVGYRHRLGMVKLLKGEPYGFEEVSL